MFLNVGVYSASGQMFSVGGLALVVRLLSWLRHLLLAFLHCTMVLENQNISYFDLSLLNNFTDKQCACLQKHVNSAFSGSSLQLT